MSDPPIDQRLPERGVSPIGNRSLLSDKRVKAALMAGAALGAIGLVAFGINNMAHDPGMQTKAAPTGSHTIGQVTTSPPEVQGVAQRKAAADTTPPRSNDPSIVVTNSVKMPTTDGELAFSVPPPKPTQTGGSANSESAKDNTTKIVFKPSTIVGARASQGQDLTYVMLPQRIPCILDGAMDSQFPGAITCHTTADVSSPAHVPLLRQGTIITGVYKNDVGGGQNRLFSFAGTATDPTSGISVNLDNSGVQDNYGITGIPGDVDHHYPEKFGGAFLLLGLDIVSSIGQTALSKPGQTNLNINSGDTTSMASDVLRKQLDIPPTITVPPGTQIMVFVDHEVSFKDGIKVSTP